MEIPDAHEDQRYIEALLNNDHRLIKEIYERWAGKVVAFVKKNNGDESQARDVIQETLIIIYRQAYEKKLVLTCPFEAYFFLLCKRRWFNVLKQNDLKEVTIDDDLTSIDRADELADSTEQFEIKQEIIKNQFVNLTDKCRELINLTLEHLMTRNTRTCTLYGSTYHYSAACRTAVSCFR